MLFNSYEFLLVFLPITLGVYLTLQRVRLSHLTIPWLVAASLFFYGWWNPRYLVLIGISIVVNYSIGRLILHRRRAEAGGPDNSGGTAASRMRFRASTVVLTLGIVFNLGILGYYKYASFFLTSIRWIVPLEFHLGTIVLPLAISFFTFQQVAYLVDVYQDKAEEYSFLHYCLFVTFFPQLIAGPIVHHGEMLPQFERQATRYVTADHLAVGVTFLALGLFKKVVIADTISTYANPVFDGAAAGAELTFLEAWGGVLAYTFQLYFDFSGYSDMAIGLARMFGIKLPLNFFSPYKAHSIIDFWRRWHMTLSRFLRDYLYIPLGGNHHGTVSRFRNLMITMVLGGLWHGAGWTFVAWGALHGLYLVINHGWRRITAPYRSVVPIPAAVTGGASRVLTFGAVVVGWVFFRSADFQTAAAFLRGMAGLNGIAVTYHQFSVLSGLPGIGPVFSHLGLTVLDRGVSLAFFRGTRHVAALAVCFVIAWGLPNTAEFMRVFRPTISRFPTGTISLPRLRWQPRRRWAVPIGVLVTWSLLSMTRVQEFLYFQF